MKRQASLQEGLPQFLNALLVNRKEILFIDEAVFSVSQNKRNVWWNPGSTVPSINVNTLYFPGVAVIAAINLEGEVVDVFTNPSSIKKDLIVKFFHRLGRLS